MKPIAHALVVAVLVLSAVLAFRLGMTWGMNPTSQYIYGSMVVLFEGLKALLPFAIAAAWQSRRYAGLVISAFAFTGIVAMSGLGTLGFAELNRATLQGTRQQSVERVATLRADIAAMTDHLKQNARHRSLNEIDVEIENALRAGVSLKTGTVALGALTSNCTKAADKRAITPCARVGELRNERAASAQHERLRSDVEKKRLLLSEASGLDLTGIGDPQVAVVARLSGVGEDTARVAINAAFAILLEFVGAFGFFIVSLLPEKIEVAQASGVAERDAPGSRQTEVVSDTDVARRYLSECVCRDVPGSVTASAMHRDYARWCATERVMPLTLTAFGLFIAQQGIEKSKVEGLVRYRGVALRNEDTLS